jgi:glycerol-3-phosphate dehydrogenase/1-acyl-sn-glycerol-3-phosphate acyltransferase
MEDSVLKKDINSGVVIIGGGPMGFAISDIISKNLKEFYFWFPDTLSYRKWKNEKIVQINDFEFIVPNNIKFVTGYDFFKDRSLILIIALPSRQFEEVIEMIFEHLNPNNHYDFILISKGFLNYHNRNKYKVYVFHQMIQELQKQHKIEGHLAVMAGPSLLYDIVQKNYILFDVGLDSVEFYQLIKEIFHQPFINFSSHNDLFSAELGAILKNPMAILIGMVSALPNVGSSLLGELAAKAFLEMFNFAKTLGANETILLGRSGISDFLGTVFSPYSRNRTYGRQFTEKLLKGSNKPTFLDQIQLFLTPTYYIEKEVLSSQNLAEGGLAISPIIEIAKEKNIQLPLYKILYNIFLRKNSPEDVLSLLIEREIQQSKIPVLRKKGKIEIVASGRMIAKALKDRVYKKILFTPGMQNRIKRQASHIISSIEKRIIKAKRQKLTKDQNNFETELKLWQKIQTCKPEEEPYYIEKIIEFYIDNMVDYFLAPIRTLIIYLVMPFRLIFGKFQRGSISPFVGGHLEEVKNVINTYPVFYAPTHRTHLDSVELAYALYFKGFPIPRAAAASVLMSNPLWGAFLRSLGAYVVDRENTRNILYLEVLTQYTTMMLESGIPALAYPEGTRSRNGKFQQIKTGLLSTAIDAYRESGREIAVIPIAISPQWVPEDLYFTGQAKDTSFITYGYRRGRVYFDFGKPILVSNFVKSDEPTSEIAKIILKEWKYHFRLQEHFVICYLLYNHLGKDNKETLLKEIKNFVDNYPGSMVTRDINKIYKKGINLLKKRDIIRETNNGFDIINPSLLEYYGNMIPEFDEEDIEYIKKHEKN